MPERRYAYAWAALIEVENPPRIRIFLDGPFGSNGEAIRGTVAVRENADEFERELEAVTPLVLQVGILTNAPGIDPETHDEDRVRNCIERRLRARPTYDLSVCQFSIFPFRPT